MNKFILAICLIPALVLAQVAMPPIRISNTSPNTTPLSIVGSPGQVDPLFTINNGTNQTFKIPTTGLIAVENGGTGVASVAALQALLTNTPTSGIVAVANGGTGTNTVAGARSVLGMTLTTNTIIYVSAVSWSTNGNSITNLSRTLATNTAIYWGP